MEVLTANLNIYTYVKNVDSCSMFIKFTNILQLNIKNNLHLKLNESKWKTAKEVIILF